MNCPSIKKIACFSEIVPGTRRSNGQCGAAEKREPDFFKRWQKVLHYSTQEGSLQWLVGTISTCSYVAFNTKVYDVVVADEKRRSCQTPMA